MTELMMNGEVRETDIRTLLTEALKNFQGIANIKPENYSHDPHEFMVWAKSIARFMSEKIDSALAAPEEMKYKGYSAIVEFFDEEAKIFHGRVVGIDDIINFESDNENDLLRAFHESVDDYLAWKKETTTAPEPGAMEIVRQIRDVRLQETALSYKLHWQCSMDDAAALIEQYGRRVPRAMLEEIRDDGFAQGMMLKIAASPENIKKAIDNSVARYGVRIEEDKE